MDFIILFTTTILFSGFLSAITICESERIWEEEKEEKERIREERKSLNRTKFNIDIK